MSPIHYFNAHGEWVSFDQQNSCWNYNSLILKLDNVMITLKRSSLKIVSIITHNENVNEVQLAKSWNERTSLQQTKLQKFTMESFSEFIWMSLPPMYLAYSLAIFHKHQGESRTRVGGIKKTIRLLEWIWLIFIGRGDRYIFTEPAHQHLNNYSP